MNRFNVGEVAEVRSVTTGEWSECEIIALPGHNYFGPKSTLKYVIDVPTDRNSNHRLGYWVCQERNLRKKRPPRDESGSWDNIERDTDGWNPTKQKVTVEVS